MWLGRKDEGITDYSTNSAIPSGLIHSQWAYGKKDLIHNEKHQGELNGILPRHHTTRLWLRRNLRPLHPFLLGAIMLEEEERFLLGFLQSLLIAGIFLSTHSPNSRHRRPENLLL